jgi:mannonate dehydratase
MELLAAVRYFGRMVRSRKIHFRNVSAPIPHFVGTFVDIGCVETWQMMRALREVNFDDVVIGDRFPGRVDSGRAALAYKVSDRARVERAERRVRRIAYERPREMRRQ